MIPINIIYEDNHLIAVNKPAGLLTQPSGTSQDSLEAQVKAWIKQAYNKPGNVFLEAVHRLDKPVSGIVLFGKTSKALSRLNASIREKKTKKLYVALVEHPPTKKEDWLEHYMVHDDYKAQIASQNNPEAKKARLHYKVIQENGDLARLEIELETGRYHQIRLQLSTINSPIVGDRKYGSSVSFLPEAIALHHSRLEIIHPVKNELLVLEAPIPEAFQSYEMR